MNSERRTNLNTFFIVWSGQLVSILGSEMTSFAMTIWAWELTQKATPLSLIFFFSRSPRVVASTFAGLVVDCYNRKHLMMLGDTVTGMTTIAILALLVTENLAIWHFYVAIAIAAFFSYFQGLSYSSSMSAIVPKQHYARATAMGSLKVFSASILAPGLAGILYYRVGFEGILIIDLITLVVAVGSLAIVRIPQQFHSENRENIWRQLTFGYRYLLEYPGLLAILFFLLGSNLFNSASMALVATAILARSDNNAAVLASVKSTMGIGGLVGAAVISIWGGFRRRVNGLILGIGLRNLCQMLLGLGREPFTWSVAAFGAAFVAPLWGSSNQAIWLAKVKPEIQGRVFATRYFIAQITTPLGAAIAGPLADRYFEPAMMQDGALAGIFGNIFGTGEGAGIALAYTLFSGCGLFFALISYAVPLLRNVEDTVPDCDR